MPSGSVVASNIATPASNHKAYKPLQPDVPGVQLTNDRRSRSRQVRGDASGVLGQCRTACVTRAPVLEASSDPMVTASPNVWTSYESLNGSVRSCGDGPLTFIPRGAPGAHTGEAAVSAWSQRAGPAVRTVGAVYRACPRSALPPENDVCRPPPSTPLTSSRRCAMIRLVGLVGPDRLERQVAAVAAPVHHGASSSPQVEVGQLVHVLTGRGPEAQAAGVAHLIGASPRETCHRRCASASPGVCRTTQRQTSQVIPPRVPRRNPCDHSNEVTGAADSVSDIPRSVGRDSGDRQTLQVKSSPGVCSAGMTVLLD